MGEGREPSLHAHHLLPLDPFSFRAASNDAPQASPLLLEALPPNTSMNQASLPIIACKRALLDASSFADFRPLTSCSLQPQSCSFPTGPLTASAEGRAQASWHKIGASDRAWPPFHPRFSLWTAMSILICSGTPVP